MTPLRAFLAGLVAAATLAFLLDGDLFLLAVWTSSIVAAFGLGTIAGRARRITDDAAYLRMINGHTRRPRSLR